MQWCGDVLHVFTCHRELLPSSLFIKSQQKLLRELKDFSSTVVTCIPDAANFTFKQKNASCLILHEERSLPRLLCMCCCPSTNASELQCGSVVDWSAQGCSAEAFSAFYLKWFVLKCSRKSICTCVKGKLLHLRKKMSEASLLREKSTAGCLPLLCPLDFLE